MTVFAFMVVLRLVCASALQLVVGVGHFLCSFGPVAVGTLVAAVPRVVFVKLSMMLCFLLCMLKGLQVSNVHRCLNWVVLLNYPAKSGDSLCIKGCRAGVRDFGKQQTDKFQRLLHL